MVKDMIVQFIDKIADECCEMADAIFDHPEMAYDEHFASSLLARWLREHGWQAQTGIAGLQTAFRAQYVSGAGGPVIGLLCEYDALKMGHGCGHHMQGPIMLMAAQAIRECVSGDYTLVIYGTPAEEGPQGKMKMMEAGCFRELDAALMTHAGPNTTVDIKSLGGVRLNVTYKGVAAHAALTPELTRSAMDALLLAYHGIAMLRSHVKEDVKFYTSITECQGTPNNQDETLARGTVSIRTYQSEDVEPLEARVRRVLEGAAMMTETTVSIERGQSLACKLPNLTLNRLIMSIAEELDAPQRLEYRTRTGATDFAYVTRMMPAAVSRFAFVPEGTTSHSQAFLDAGKSKRAHDGMRMSARILALTMLALITNPEILALAKAEFAERSANASL